MSAIADIRARTTEITYQTQDGRQVTLPDLATAGADFDFRKWLSEQGPGEMMGPQVRAAGRIVLHRDKGKLQFIDIRDMTGQIQLFVGAKQVGAFHAFDLTAQEVDLHLLDHGSSHSALHLADGTSIHVDASPDFGLWVVWTLAGKDYVCLEPWTAPGNALNSGERLLWLEPGAAHDAWVEFGDR